MPGLTRHLNHKPSVMPGLTRHPNRKPSVMPGLTRHLDHKERLRVKPAMTSSEVSKRSNILSTITHKKL